MCLWLLPHHCMLIVLYLGWVLLLARGICLVPEVKYRCKPLPILLFGKYSWSNLVSITDGVSTWSPSMIHTRWWQYLFSILQMLAKLFYELVQRYYCLHFSDCIMDLEQAVFYCSSNCSYLNEEKQYPDNSMYSLMFLASILVTNYQATFFRLNTTKLLAQIYHLICILWLQLRKTFWTPGYVFDKEGKMGS